MERIRYSPGRTYVAAVDERPSVREVRDTLAAEIAGVPRAARRPLGSVNVTAAPTSLAARTVVEVEVPLVGVLKAKAESEWVRSASGPGSDQIARRSARTVGVASAVPAVDAAPSFPRKAEPRAIGVALAQP